jgi:hypothetical protein
LKKNCQLLSGQLFKNYFESILFYMNKLLIVIALTSFISTMGLAQPVVTAPTVSGITHNSAILGGSISGSGITARGTAWKTSSPVAITDDQLPEGGTSAGAFSHTRSPLPSGTQIFFVAYGTNGGGSSTSLELSFYTLSAPPSGQPASFTALTVSNNQINLAWGTVTANGFLIYRRAGGTAPDVSGITNGNAPPPSLADGSSLVSTEPGISVSYNDGSLSPGTQYSYTIVPFGYNGANSQTYNYLTIGAPTVTAFTLSNPPSGQPATFSATAIGSSQIDLAWAAVTANGFLIYRRAGATAPNVSAILNGFSPPGTLADASTLVTAVSGSATSLSNNAGLSPATQYSYTIVPFGYDGTNSATYYYLTASALTANAITFTATSMIALNGGTTTTINYIDYPTVGGPLINSGGGANSVSLARFRITDTDGDPTTLTSITLSIANSANVSEIAIFDNGDNNRGQVTNPGSSVTFSGLTGISAPSSGTTDFEIFATFNDTVVEGQVITLTVTSATTTFSGIASFGATTGGTDNRINVSANQFRFSLAGVPVTVLPTTAPNANFGPLTVAAIDANGNIDLSRSQSVTLSLNAGSGSLNGTPSLVQSLSGGTTTFPDLRITAAGAKTIRAVYGGSGISQGFININISTPGVEVLPGTLSNSPLCYSGLAQTISPITIRERDPGDFSSGGSFSLILPANFFFDTSVTTAPSISGNEISGMSTLSYSGGNTVSFSYSISGTSNATLDQIVINGLKVRYTGTTPVASANLVRFGGTAIQAGNSSSDALNYCTLSSLNSTTTVDFTVLTVSGQPAVDPTDVSFSVTVGSVQLDGNPSGGVFSGPGVTFNAGLNAYFFSPSSVGVSTGNQIIYTYKETSTLQQCNVTRTKSFNVYASVIQGLQSQYCDNGTPDALTVLPANIPSGYELHDFLYYAGFVRSSPTSTYTLSFNYNKLGTNTVAYQITYSYISNVYQGFSITADDPTAGTISNFDPTLNLSYPNRNFIQIFYRIRETLNPANIVIYRSAITRIVNKPSVSFSLPKYNYCSNEVPQQFIGTPTPTSIVTDEFVTIPPSAGGISNVGNVWTFTPSGVVAGQINTPFKIRYNYTSPTTGCSHFSEADVTVFSIPSAPALAEVNTGVPVCNGGAAGTFTGSGGSIYSWYVNSNLLPVHRRATLANAYIPVSQISNPSLFDINTTINQANSFFVTKTINGCESPSTTVTMIVSPPPTLTINSSTQICDGGMVDISQGAVNAVLDNGASSATWSTSGTGQFLNSSSTIISVGPFSLGTAVRYQPSSTDVSNGSVNLTLTTNAPNPPCPADAKIYQVTINLIPSRPISTIPNSIPVVPGVSELVEYCDNTIVNNLSVTGTNVKWYSDAAKTTQLSSLNPFAFPFNPSSSRDVSFYVTQTQNNCESPNLTIRVLLHPVPTPTGIAATNLCLGDLTTFNAPLPVLNGPSAPYTISSYNWNLGPSTSTQANPAYTYSALGFYNISVGVISNKGCVGNYSLPSPLEIGPIPQANFRFDNLCIGDVTNFTSLPGPIFDNTSPGRTIQTYAWNFDDPSSGSSNASTLANPSHTYNSVGKFNNVRLSLVSVLGCSATQTQQVYILPYLKNNVDFPYSENFESNDGGWAGAGVNTTTSTPVWNYGVPSGTNINAANGSTNCWFISKVGNAYDKNIRATLNSPCIDVSKLPRPVLSFDYYNDTKLGSDGVYLESSTDGGVTWSRAGNMDQGISWYNAGPIGGLSLVNGIGQSVSQIGWSNQKTGWTESAFALDNPSFDFRNQTKLRLRFVFGTDPATKFEDMDGFAIDNVRLSSRNRILLIETFTNENAPRFTANNTNFKSLTNEVSKVQYHTSFPNQDSQSALSMQDVSARSGFYGINSSPGASSLIPRSYIDGRTSNGIISDFSDASATSWWNTFKSTRGLSVSPFDITITNPPSANNNQITVNLSLKATAPLAGSRRLIALIALVEKSVGSTNTFVVRKMIPSASGISISTPITLGQIINIPSITIDVPNVNPNEIAFVAWVQDLDNSKEVLQSQVLLNPPNLPSVVTAVEPTLSASLSFYPVPADKELLVSLPEVATINTHLTMHDAVGKVVQRSTIEKGQQSKAVSTEELAGGVYLIQLETDKGTVRKKVMVVH